MTEPEVLAILDGEVVTCRAFIHSGGYTRNLVGAAWNWFGAAAIDTPELQPYRARFIASVLDREVYQ
jgi:hypothetical protein